MTHFEQIRDNLTVEDLAEMLLFACKGTAECNGCVILEACEASTDSVPADEEEFVKMLNSEVPDHD